MLSNRQTNAMNKYLSNAKITGSLPLSANCLVLPSRLDPLSPFCGFDLGKPLSMKCHLTAIKGICEVSDPTAVSWQTICSFMNPALRNISRSIPQTSPLVCRI